LYQGKQVNCLHCKASIIANEAQAIAKPPPPKGGMAENKSDLPLWKKLCSFKFKELTRSQVLACVAVVIVLVASLILNPPFKSKTRKGSSNRSNTRKELTPSHDPVVRYIKDNAKNPSSIEIMDYSEPRKVKDGVYKIRVRYRGQNGFGGYSVEDRIFYLHKGDGVWNVRPN